MRGAALARGSRTWSREHAAAGNCSAGFVSFGEKFAEAIEASFPGSAVIANPCLEQSKALGIYPAGTDPAKLLSVHEANLFEDQQVLRDGGEGDAQRIRQSRDGHGTAGQTVENRAARGIAQRVKQTIDLGVGPGHC